MYKILDCTLRDGGYYTNWDFSRELVDKYIETVSNLPIDYVEVGYRSPAKSKYLGEFFYTPIETINRIKSQLDSSIKIAIMINTKDVDDVNELEKLLLECVDKVNLIRFTVAPSNIEKSILYAKKTQELGFEVALNLMYISQNNAEELLEQVDIILESVPNIDFIYLVDSYGSCLPFEVKEKFKTIKMKHSALQLGFHGHDNIQLAFSNSLEAIDVGVNIIDATITGMGRGAGNLSTELICSYTATQNNLEFDYTNLVDLVEKFNELKLVYGWGNSLPYIISGFNKLPQGEVMDLISLKRFSTNKIVKIIENKIHNKNIILTDKNVKDLSIAQFESNKYDFSILVGGGTSVSNHFEGLRLLNEKFNILFIHSTTKHLDMFMNDDDNFNNLVCLPGDEVNKIKYINYDSSSRFVKFVISNDADIDKKYINSNFYTIGESTLDELIEDDIFTKEIPLLMSLKVIDILNIENYYVIGFDGYEVETQANKMLRNENQIIMNNYSKQKKKLNSLTPSKYDIEVISLYSLIVHGIN